MFVVVGRIANKDDADRGFIERHILADKPTSIQNYLIAIAANYGGTTADYYGYEITDQNVIDRISNGDEWILVWTNDEITDIDFSIEDVKLIVDFVTNDDNILANGTDKANVTVTVYKADGIEVKTNFTADKVCPIMIDGREVYTMVHFVNGVATLSFSRARGEVIKMPYSIRIFGDTVRVRTSAEITFLEVLE